MSKLPNLYKNNIIPDAFTVATTFYNNSENDTFVSGRVLENDSRVSAESLVSLFEADSMNLVSTTTTYNNGFFRFLNLNPSLKYTIIAKDKSGKGYNSVVLDNIYPATYNFLDETYPDYSIKPVRIPLVYPDVIVNEPTPSSFLLNIFTFKSTGFYDNNNQGTWSSTDITFKQTVSGPLGTFNGSTSKAVTTSTLPSLTFTGDFTLTFLINVTTAPSASSTGSYIISQNNDTLSATYFSLFLTKDMQISFRQNATNLMTSTTVLQTGTWYEVTLTREDDSRLSLFINGIKEVHYDLSGTISFNVSGTRIGYGTGAVATYPYLAMTIQSFKVYNKAIYSRDFGETKLLKDLKLFNDNLKIAILFDGTVVEDIVSSLAVTNSNVTISTADYDDGNSSGYFNTSYVETASTSFLNLSTVSNFTIEFAFKPIDTVTSSTPTFTVLSVENSFRIAVENGQVVYKDATNTYTCPFNLPSNTSWNKIRVSRKGTTIGLFINDILQVKFLSPTFSNTSNKLRLGSRFANSEYFKGYIDTVKVYTNYVNYDFNAYLEPVDQWSVLKVSDFPFTSTFYDTVGSNSYTVTGSLNYSNTTCVSPPQSVYKSALDTGWYTSAPFVKESSFNTIQGWFCIGSQRSGTEYPLFDMSYSNAYSTYAHYFSIDATTFKLKYYAGSAMSETGSVVTVTYNARVFNIGEWFQFAVEYNPILKKILAYVDDVLVLEIPHSIGWKYYNSSNVTKYLRIGYTAFSASANDWSFPGWIDDIRVYSGVATRSSSLTDLYNPSYHAQGYIAGLLVPESLVFDRSLDTPQYLTTWTDLSRRFNSGQSTEAYKPLIVKGATSSQDYLEFDGIDDYVSLSGSHQHLISTSSFWNYIVVKPSEISTTVATRQTILCYYQGSLAEAYRTLEISLGDGINIENNNKIVLTSKAYATSSSSYFYSSVISSSTLQVGQWYAIRTIVGATARTLSLYINGALVGYMSGAFYNNSVTSSGEAASFSVGRDALKGQYFKGGVAAVFAGNASYPLSDASSYKFDKHYSDKFGVILPDTHPYKNQANYLGTVLNG